MKRILIYLSVASSLVYLNSCDKIEGNHFENNAATDTNYTFPADTSADVYRVLLEDYTGHTCGNCPVASADLYNNIKPAYGDKLVTIGVHADFFAEPCPPHSRPQNSPIGSYADDFRCAASTAWYNFFGFQNNPLGLVNRKDYPAHTQIKSAGSWNTEIASIVNRTPKVKIRIHNVYNKTTRQLQTYSETKFLAQYSGTCKLNVVLTEDSIVTWQLVDTAATPNDPNYIHRHVLRGSLNGSFGEQLTTASITNADTKFFKGLVTTISPAWNAKHLHVVVFLYDDATKEILNVAEDAVIE